MKFSLPQLGHWMWCSLMKSIIFSLDQPSALSPVKSSMSLSARWRVLQSLQSIRGSEKPPTWPVATHTWGFIKMAASTPTLVGDSCTNFFHQAFFTLFLNSTPRGP